MCDTCVEKFEMHKWCRRVFYDSSETMTNRSLERKRCENVNNSHWEIKRDDMKGVYNKRVMEKEKERIKFPEIKASTKIRKKERKKERKTQ